MLKSLTDFLISPENISIIKSPYDYYNTVLSMITNAKFRLSLSSLYLGTSKLETKLLQRINHKQKVNKNLKLKIIMDLNRCQRKEHNIRTVDLINKYNLTKHLYLYNNPCAKIKRIFPTMLRELFGVFHTKIIISDNDILITGANLSKSYFTNRKDRYYYISNSNSLANYLDTYLNNISTITPTTNKNQHKSKLILTPTSFKFNLSQIINELPSNKILFYPTVKL